MLKKLLASIILSIFFLTYIFVPQVRAQSPPGPWYNQDFRQWYVKVYDEQASPPSEIFGERYTAAQVQWVIYGLWAFLVNTSTGPDNTERVTCFLNNDFAACVDAISEVITYTGDGPAYAENSQKVPLLKAIFADRPFSGIGYVKEKLRNLHIIPEAQAQEGFGFNALGPIRPLWQGARDIAYTLFVFIAVVLAFMIMFRIKIAPQIVITAQSALPKLAIALVLVTFSYAIAGFLIDLMYVVIGLIALLINQSGTSTGSTVAYQFLTGEFSAGVFSIQVGIFEYYMGYLVWFGLSFLASLFVLVSPLVAVFYGPIFILISIIAFIVLLLVFLFATLKTLWMLFKAVANVYLLTIFAPFQLAIGALIPQGGFGSWLRNLAANLAVFPVVGLLIYLAFLFIFYSFLLVIETALNNSIAFGVSAGDIINYVRDIWGIKADFSLLPGEPWSPPLIGLAGRAVPLTFVMASLAIMLIIPKVADIIKSLIQGKPFGYGTAIGEAFGPVKPIGVYGAAYGTEKGLRAFGGVSGSASQYPAAYALMQTIRRALGIR